MIDPIKKRSIIFSLCSFLNFTSLLFSQSILKLYICNKDKTYKKYMKEIELPNGAKFRYYTPKELKAHLDEYIIGQDEAKRILSVAVYNHYKRIILSHENPDAQVEKSNIIMAGPTGCGKSAMIKCLADYMGVPCYIADATTLTQAGYVGDDVESIITGLLRKCGWGISMAEYGIVAIDEVDKIAKKGANQHISRDVVGEGVQQALLKMVEGDLIGVPPQEGRKHPDQPLIYVNTKNILFVATGAFSGLDDIIKGRLNLKKIGYTVEKKIDVSSENFEPFEYMSQDDLRKFGMIPEFIGRFPVLANVNELNKEDLVRILTEPKNALVKQYQTMMLLDGINLHIDNDALELVADIALKIGTGARGLRSMMESILNEFVYELSDNTEETERDVNITKADVESKINKRYSTYLEKKAA
jgi:ATP-dependent Clp protease ATP-binding subunit ClpX